MKRYTWRSVLAAFTLAASSLVAAPVASASDPAPLAGTDELDRVLPQNLDVGGPQHDKQVALFYFLWHERASTDFNPGNWVIEDILDAHPEALNDPASPHWGSAIDSGNYYYWGEPLWGFYESTDYWIHLKNVQLLTDAGVDILVLDTTNGPPFTYSESADALMDAIDTVAAQGKNPPKVAFYTNSSSGDTMQKVYDDFYKPGAPYAHPDATYQLDGKPLIIGRTGEAAGRDYENFFTYRQSQWPNEGAQTNGWPWMEFQRPQRVFSNSAGEREIVNVSLAQHPNGIISNTALYGDPGAWGRSYHDGAPGAPGDTPYGYNAQEQWDFAIAQNTPFIFVTGWNEWIAARWSYNNGRSNFVDAVTPEYSRDIEPSADSALKDNYYMQFVDNVRRYKGVEAPAPTGGERTITAWSDWDAVPTTYQDYRGDTLDRDHVGAPEGEYYVNTTGRNDLDTAKVARDSTDLYFSISATDALTPSSDSGWMRLFLDTDRSRTTGWNGYDYRVVGGDTLERYVNGAWADAGTIDGSIDGDRLMVTVPRAAVGLTSDPINFEFKWSDNMQADDPMDWYVNGDAAPGGRLNAVYSTASDGATIPLANSGFESPQVSGLQYTPSGGSWSFDTGLAGVQRNGSAFGAPTAPGGAQTAFLQRDGGITLTPSFPTSGRYQIRYSAANRAGYAPQTITAYVDGVAAGSVTPSNTTGFATYYSEPFSVNAGDHAIRLAGQGGGDRTAFVDDVEIVPLLALQNGGFESPAISNFQYAPAGSGWTYGRSAPGIAGAGGSFAVPSPIEGAQVGFVQRGGHLSHAVDVAAAGTYKVRFLGANRPGYPTQTVRVLIDGQPVGDIVIAADGGFQTYESTALTLGAGKHTITLAGLASDDRTAFVDRVEVLLG